VTKFRKKPVEIEAIRLPMPGEQGQKVADFFRFLDGAEWELGVDGLRITTLEGVMMATPGDYIIRGIKGEFYPCKPDIFALTYEPVEPALASQEA